MGYITNQEDSQKIITLFEYIKALNSLKHKKITNIADNNDYWLFSDFPADPQFIQISYRDRTEDSDGSENDPAFFFVRKPDLAPCPAPKSSFVDWLKPGWDDFRREAQIREIMYLSPENVLYNEKPEEPEPPTTPLENIETEESSDIPFQEAENTAEEKADTNSENTEVPQPPIPTEPAWSVVSFDDDSERAADFSQWNISRTEWADEQRTHDRTRTLFQELYTAYNRLKLESETLEMVVANGFFKKKGHPTINHPILTRRVRPRFDANRNTLFLEDTDSSSELYSDVLNGAGEDLSTASLHDIRTALNENDYHPLDRVETASFLRTTLNHLTPHGVFSENGELLGWEKENEYILFCSPVIILRKRSGEADKAIDRIIEDIQNGGEIPLPILEFINQKDLSGAEYIPQAESLEEQLASVGGESPEILLCKEANREQLEIAKQIEVYNGVIVQGPPGTGKTHTIANLMGHFLSQGKSVLVTSSTKKALTVLKEKVTESLQGMIVSILEDSNADMEKSVAAITEYVQSHNLGDLTAETEKLRTERNEIMQELGKKRRRLFQLIQRENHSIVFDGMEYSLIELAKFVDSQRETLSYIPGTISPDQAFPLNDEDLRMLYESNQAVHRYQNARWDQSLSLSSFPPPDVFSEAIRSKEASEKGIQNIVKTQNWEKTFDQALKRLVISLPRGTFLLEPSEDFDSERLMEEVMDAQLTNCTEEKIGLLRAGMDEEEKYYWDKCIEQVKDTEKCSAIFRRESFGKTITIEPITTHDKLQKQLLSLRNVLEKYGAIGFFDRLHGRFNDALRAVKINHETIKTVEDCDLVLHAFELEQLQSECEAYWDQIAAPFGYPKFAKLDGKYPEKTAAQKINEITSYLSWYDKHYRPLVTHTEKAGIIAAGTLESPTRYDLDQAVRFVNNVLPDLIKIKSHFENLIRADHVILDILRMENQVIGFDIFESLINAVKTHDPAEYAAAYYKCADFERHRNLFNKREELLRRLRPTAPEWAQAVQTQKGIHSQENVPENIHEAWKWSQKNTLLNQILSESESELMADCEKLSLEYRRITEKYSAKKAWLHVLKRNQRDKELQSALIGWRQVIKKIGKGTGKRAAKYRVEARALMSKCQRAVPAWIMPINRALESLNCRDNKFDVVILDEASQADISALAILYMGKKLIVVGDDKQVSPEAIGEKSEDVIKLQHQLFSDRPEMSHLYEPDTSIYDIAETTFNHLMLKEHFRCVPEIIGFSNWLSYDYRIKPLRSGSDSCLLPAVVNYRVEGQRSISGKTNTVEAKSIVALMKACIEQSEYAGKTFGVISLLGADQSKKIQTLIEAHLDAKEIEERRILCGTPANFQGDERDVIFLSMVDSNPEGNGPLPLRTEGKQDSYKKRYNVAVSRAKDQLWVVHSLDAANDLKDGDIRKKLLDYAADPNSFEQLHEKIEKKAESPFESEVATKLTDLGYHLEQQWKVGSYRLDMVAIYQKNMVAIECDGERFHSSEEQIRNDMERQTILERVGWKFIRIRGSEYYLNPQQTLERVTKELTACGISPESIHSSETRTDSFDLYERVVQQAKASMEPEAQTNLTEPPTNVLVPLISDAQTTESVRAYNSQDNTPLKGNPLN